jgi:hypothetical protein
VAPADLATVAALVRRSGTSFYHGMRVLPPERRAAMYAIYAFCRRVDDIADEPGAFAAKLPQLAAWRARVAGLYCGAADDAETRVLRAAVQRFGLREADFLAVIDGMQMDAEQVIVAPDLATLDLYCDRVAAAVGRQIAAIEIAQIARAILQMIEHLERAAQRIGGGMGRRVLAVQIEHVAADRHRRIAAILQQRRPAFIALLRRILAEGAQQIARMPRVHPGLGQAAMQRGGTRRTVRPLAEQHRLHHVEPHQLLGRRQGGAVGDVIGVAGKGVEGMHVAAQVAADQDRADREILIRAVLAGPALDIAGCGIGEARAHAPPSVIRRPA